MSNIQLLNQIREMIISGKLEPGKRIVESTLAEKTGVSRTPIRAALPVLETEGYIEPIGKRGYAVKKFNSADALKTIEVRACLEGLAASHLAINGCNEKLKEKLQHCLQEGDEIFKKRYLTIDDEAKYGDMNTRFHKLIVDNCGSQVLIDTIERLNNMPFIGPAVMVFDKDFLNDAYDALFHAHAEHHSLLEAIVERNPRRAEALFREHGNAQKKSLIPRIKQSAQN